MINKGNSSVDYWKIAEMLGLRASFVFVKMEKVKLRIYQLIETMGG